MRQRTWLHAAPLSLLCFGLLMFVFNTSKASPSPVRTPKCTVDIADGKTSDCTLIKAKDEWILWSNSSPTSRSIHFKPNDNPFMEKSCWDVDPGARARSGPIARTATPKTYISYASGVPCASTPPSDANRSAPKVIVE